MKKLFLIIYLALVAILISTYFCNAQDWKPNPKYIKHYPTRDQEPGTRYQCYGTTQAGQRCKNHVKTDSAFCHLHSNQTLTH